MRFPSEWVVSWGRHKANCIQNSHQSFKLLFNLTQILPSCNWNKFKKVIKRSLLFFDLSNFLLFGSFAQLWFHLTQTLSKLLLSTILKGWIEFGLTAEYAWNWRKAAGSGTGGPTKTDEFLGHPSLRGAYRITPILSGNKIKLNWLEASLEELIGSFQWEIKLN